MTLSLTRTERQKLTSEVIDGFAVRDGGAGVGGLEGALAPYFGSLCMYREALYFWSLGISLYFEFFVSSFIINLCSGTHRRSPRFSAKTNIDK